MNTPLIFSLKLPFSANAENHFMGENLEINGKFCKSRKHDKV
jgi:hypothetical protein